MQQRDGVFYQYNHGMEKKDLVIIILLFVVIVFG